MVMKLVITGVMAKAQKGAADHTTRTREVTMDAGTKLLDLLGGINFKVIDIRASGAEFRETVRYNEKQYAKIEAMGDQYEERIIDLMCLILAEKLQPIMVSRFGDTSDYALSQLFREQFDTPRMKSEWEYCKGLALEAIRGEGLDSAQMEIVGKIIDNLPETLIDLLVWIVGRLKVIPVQEAGSLSKILVHMIEEGSNANETGSG
jgi:hypothetical protein